MQNELIFVKPCEKYILELKAYRQEFIDNSDSLDGCGPLRKYDDIREYLKDAESYLSPETLPAGKVIATQFLCIRKSDSKLVGMLQVRHYFNDFLEKYAGHIGYSVRPSERKKGYATWMLANIKPFCKSINLDKILVCCEVQNEASRKTILKNGGVYDKTVFCEEHNTSIERYWIDLT